jgi:hypothetical protein
VLFNGNADHIPSGKTKKTTKKKKKKVVAAKKPTTATNHQSTRRPETCSHYRLNLADIPFVAGKVIHLFVKILVTILGLSVPASDCRFTATLCATDVVFPPALNYDISERILKAVLNPSSK